MDGSELREARLERGWTQLETAERLGVTQAYLSMLERGKRVLPRGLTRKVVEVLHAAPTALPFRDLEVVAASGGERLPYELAALGYPEFEHLRGGVRRNPAEVLFHALNQAELDARVAEGLPWVAMTYAEMKWDWLVQNAKLYDRQNRVGFVVTLAQQVAERAEKMAESRRLEEYVSVLERSRLVREDTLGHEKLTEAEKKWLRANRSEEAKHWNLLTDMRVENLPYAKN
jgi:transcriptional regulator with XRE-family HTH domain